MAPHSPADQFAQVDVNGHAWVAGYTENSLDGHSAGGRDIFLMKFAGEGVHQWTDQRGGKGDDVARALQADVVRRPSFSNLSHGGKHKNSLRCPCSSSPFKFSCSTCYKVKISVKIRYSDVCGGSLIDVLGLNWNRQNGIMFECLELVKILKNPEDYLPETQKRIKPTGA